uniref:Inner centromere protein ARK-binding domain-containing protein n=1 Tax=Leersia perrieri TaxID=77586 RepID=A0A0D9X968_9ORYZ
MEELFIQIFERRDRVKEQMRQHVVSHSESLACAILAAGRRPPPWLLPRLDPIPARGNTLKKTSSDLANLKNEDSLHNVQPQTYQRIEPKTLEFGGGKPGGLHIVNCPGEIDQSQKCVFESVVKEFSVTHSINEGPLSTSLVEVPHFVMSSLLQKDTLQPVESNLQEIPYSVISPLPDEGTMGVPEFGSLIGMTCMASQPLESVTLQSLKPIVLERPDSVFSPLSQKKTTEAGDTVSLTEQDAFPLSTILVEVPHSVMSSLLEKDTLQPVESNLQEIPHSVISSLPDEGTMGVPEYGSLTGMTCMASQLLESVTLQSLKPIALEGPDSVFSPLSQKETTDTGDTVSLTEQVAVASPRFGNDPLQPIFLEVADSVLSPLPEKDAVHTVEMDSITGPIPVAFPLSENGSLQPEILKGPDSFSCPLPEGDAIQSAETDSVAGLISMTCLHFESDSLQINLLKAPDSVPTPMSQTDTRCFAETDSLEGPCSVANFLLEKDEANCPVGPNSMTNLLLEKEPGNMFETDSLEKPHQMTNTQLENATIHSVEANFPEESHSVASLPLEKVTHKLETLFLEESYCPDIRQPEKDSLHREEHTGTPRKFNFSAKTIDENMKILEQQSSECHVLSPCDGSSLQPDRLAIITCKAPKMLATPHDNMLGDECGYSLNPEENMPDDDHGHILRSYLGGSVSVSSLTRSAAKEKLLRKPNYDGDVYQSNIFSSGTMFNHGNPNNCNATEVLEAAQNESFQTHSSLSNPSLEYDMICTAADKSLQGEAILHSVNCQQEQGDHAQAKLVQGGAYNVYVRNNMNESMMPERTSTESAEKSLRNHAGTEHVIFGFDIALEINSDSCKTVSDNHTQVTEPSAQHLIHSSRCGKVTPMKSDVQSTDSHQGTSVADVIQVHENSSCERIEMNRQSDQALYSSSSTMSTSSMDCQHDILDKMENRAYILGKPQHSVCQLDSSGSRECISVDLEQRNDTSTWKSPMSYIHNHTSVNSSSQRSMSGLSDVMHCNSLMMKSLSCTGNSLSGNVATVPQDSLSSCSDILSGDDGQYTRKTDYCSVYPDVEHVQVEDQILIQTDYVLSGSVVLNPNNHPSSTPPTTFLSYDSSGEQSQQACASNCSNKKLGEKGNHGDPEVHLVSDGDIPLHKNTDNCADSDETVEVSCGIPIPANSPTIKERVLEAYHDSAKWVNLSSILSEKINSKITFPLMSKYESLTARFEKLLGPSSLMEVEPYFGKYSLEKLPGAHYTYEGTGSDSSTVEENENCDKPSGFPFRNYSSHGLTGRKPLERVASYQSKEKSASLSRKPMDVGRLDLPTTKASSREFDQPMKNPKENRAPSIRKEVKVTKSLHGRESKGRILGNQTERQKSEANLDKGWKPSNIVSSMTSFIPLVKQKQQPTTAGVKRDVRVKALEVAEAAKRRQQKKQNEREMRKAAAELERERLKQEREQKQKQIEQKTKIDADIVTRKRQWEDYGRKEKEKKKKCIEEPRKQQKQLEERMHAGNSGKYFSQKDPDDTELMKNIVGVVINQLSSDENTESFPILVTPRSNNVKAMVADGKSGSSGHQIHGNLSDDADKSYEMSPCEDSDEEDDGDLEHKREIRRRQKSIPQWTRKEILDKILSSNQILDPREIFERKRSFSLSNVLAPHIPQRRLMID